MTADKEVMWEAECWLRGGAESSGRGEGLYLTCDLLSCLDWWWFECTADCSLVFESVRLGCVAVCCKVPLRDRRDETCRDRPSDNFQDSALGRTVLFIWTQINRHMGIGVSLFCDGCVVREDKRAA